MLSIGVPQSTTSAPLFAKIYAIVPPPPWSTFPNSPTCHVTSPELKIFLTSAKNSELASLEPDFTYKG